MERGRWRGRAEDDALLRGRGRFLGARRAEGALALAVVRSPVAAGRVRQVDLEAARAAPGVLAAVDLAALRADGVGGLEPRLRHPGPDDGRMRAPPFPLLADGRARYMGQPVAVVVARDAEAAEAAAEAAVVEIDPEPAVTDPREAAAPDAPRVWRRFPDNLCFRVEKGDAAAVEAAFAAADRVVRRSFRVSRVTAAPLEPRSALGTWEPARAGWYLETGTQAPNRVAADLAVVFGVGAEAVRVVSPAVGGGFGMKNAGYPEQALAMWAARRFGKPVLWKAGRLESFLSDAAGRDQWADAALALDAEGRFLALDVRIAAGLGAVLGPSTAHPPVANLGGLAGMYRTPAIRAVVEGWFTNAVFTAPYRGAGRPEATYVLERLIDIAAAETGVDRVELRRRNLIRPEEMPFRTGLDYAYDSGDFPRVMERALEAADWSGFPARREAAGRAGRLRGIGLANAVEIAGGPAGGPQPEFARLSLAPDGAARLLLGASDSGQGHDETFRRLLAARLGLDAAAVEVVTGDGAAAPRGVGSFGSRTLAAAGTATRRAADALVERLTPLAAERLEAAPADLVFEEGAWRVAGTDRGVAFPEVLARAEAPLEEEALVSAPAATFPNGCHVCEAEVDPETGRVTLERYVVVDDVGVVMNPDLVEGQIQGGVAQGIGQAIMEEMVHAPGDGALLTASFMDYAMPRALDTPSCRIESAPTPTQANPLGVKGVGEAGVVGSLPAVMSAVADALSPLGLDHLDMPATPLRVWTAIAAAGGDASPRTGDGGPCGASSSD